MSHPVRAVVSRAFTKLGATTPAGTPSEIAETTLQAFLVSPSFLLLPELTTTFPNLPHPEPISESGQRQRFFESLARAVLAESAPLYLAGAGLFSDPRAAGEAIAAARVYVNRVVDDVRRRGASVIEMEGEQVVFSVPADWDGRAEQSVAEAARAYLPAGVELSFGAHYAALYARAPGTSDHRRWR